MKKIVLYVVIGVMALILLGIGSFFYLLTPVDKENIQNIEFVIAPGSSTKTVIKNLKDNKFIRSDIVTLIYTKLNNDTIKSGTYNISPHMSTKEILNVLYSGKSAEQKGITITFVEGKRVPYYVDKLVEAFDFSEDDIYNLLKDDEYLDSLIKNYWFLTDDIKDSKLYYSLEGYLYPDTYNFSVSSSIKDIFKIILDNTNRKLSGLKDVIESSNLTIHEVMTLSSIVELEGARSHDRAGIAGVFMNRIRLGITLGSDVTTYYAEQKDFTSDLTINEINDCNAYNTRGTCVKDLPIGPICNPGMESINASINPTTNDYLFFVADKNGKTYFSKTNAEHVSTIKELKNSGLWYYYN